MVQFYKAIDGIHKYVAVFENPYQEVPFGAEGYSDFIQSRNLEKKKAYLARHRVREDWNNPRTPGALSRWILWNKPTLENSINDYIKRFHIH